MNKRFSNTFGICRHIISRYGYSTLNSGNTRRNFTYDMRFLDDFVRPSGSEVLSILVHWPFDYTVFSKLQNLSTFSLVADGAANKLSKLFASMPSTFRKFPDAVVGDFDSANKEALDYFNLNRVEIINNTCQENTDSEKCLLVFEEWFKTRIRINPNKTYNIFICGGLGGRLDHVMNNFHVVYKYSKKFAEENKNVNILLMDNNSIATCLLPGKTTYLKSKKFEKNDGCGIFPLFSEARVKTTGFKWNLSKDRPLEFGIFTSSSNEMVEDSIIIENDEPVMWTTTNCLHEKYRKLKQNLMKQYSLE